MTSETPTRTSLAFTSSGAPLIGYNDQWRGLKLARRATSWATEVVAPARMGGWHSSLALDSRGDPAVCHFEWTDNDLRLARWNGSAWTADIVDPSVGQRGYSSLAFDAADRPAIAYCDNPWGGLELARHDGTAWTLEEVDPLECMHASLAFDANGHPAISYSVTDAAGSGVRFARHDGSAWTIDVVYDAEYTRPTSLAFLKDGNPAIAFATDGSNDLYYARHDGASWTTEVVDAAGYTVEDVSLAVGPTGLPAIFYLDWAAMEMRLASFDGSGWALEPVDAFSGTPWQTSALAFDPAGNPSVACFVSPEVRFAVKSGATWQRDVVDRTTRLESSDGVVSLAYGPAGDPVLSYHNACTTSPRIARRTTGGQLYRATVADLSGAWKPAVLPLDDSHDVPTAVFPLDVGLPGASRDDDTTNTAPLTLYRVLLPGDLDAGNVMRAVKAAAGVDLTY